MAKRVVTVAGEEDRVGAGCDPLGERLRQERMGAHIASARPGQPRS